MRRGTFVLALILSLPLSPWPDAVSGEQRGPIDGSSSAVGLGRGFAALEEGRPAEAATIADRVLARRPFDHAALVLAIRARVAGGQVGVALDLYDQYVRNRGHHDRLGLGAVAEGVLWQIGTSAEETAQRVQALQALAAAGDLEAAGELSDAAASGAAEGLTALAELGDVEAAEDLLARARAAGPAVRPELLAALADANPEGASEVVIPLLEASDGVVRANAAEALGRMRAETAAPALTELLSDPSPQVRQAAALGLAQLNRSEGEELVSAMLAAGVPDVVLWVAEALPDRVDMWRGAVEPMLETESPVDRLRAARLLSAVAPDATQVVIEHALADPNPAVREEAARVFAEVGPSSVDGADWRRLLTDPSTWVRLAAARALWWEITGATPTGN